MAEVNEVHDSSTWLLVYYGYLEYYESDPDKYKVLKPISVLEVDEVVEVLEVELDIMTFSRGFGEVVKVRFDVTFTERDTLFGNVDDYVDMSYPLFDYIVMREYGELVGVDSARPSAEFVLLKDLCGLYKGEKLFVDLKLGEIIEVAGHRADMKHSLDSAFTTHKCYQVGIEFSEL